MSNTGIGIFRFGKYIWFTEWIIAGLAVLATIIGVIKGIKWFVYWRD